MRSAQRKIAAPEQQLRAARDLRLIAAYRSGRPEAFEELVCSYEAQVRRILGQLNVSPGDAEDLTQEVFLRIFRNLQRFRGQSSFYTWLYRITINVFFDHNKKRKRADVRLARLQNEIGDASNLNQPSGDPYSACYDAMTVEGLNQAIAALPAPFREVVAMREVDQLSYEEIAHATGISIGTVRSRLSRARTKLKELLRPMLVQAA
jgi:RNA polymerase sigma-70 factor (ECF subfamily)